MTTSAAFRAGREAWPSVKLPPEEFARFVEGKELSHAADLYLACACASGLPEALQAFDAAFLQRPAALLGAARDAAALGPEVAQELREKLFSARPGKPPRIADYTGRGPLLGWLRVAAARAASNLRRSDDVRARVAEAAPALVAAADPELQLLKARSRGAFEQALRAAFRNLTAEERNLLRLRFLDGLNIDKLAAIFQVHRATAARRLQAARARVLEETLNGLRAALKLPEAELEELFGLVQSRLDVSLRGLFGEP